MHVQGMSLPTVMFATFDYTGKTRMESVTEKLLRFELKSPSGVIMSKKVVAIVGSYRKGGTVDTAGCPSQYRGHSQSLWLSPAAVQIGRVDRSCPD
jgi:hypothetical protein